MILYMIYNVRTSRPTSLWRVTEIIGGSWNPPSGLIRIVVVP